MNPTALPSVHLIRPARVYLGIAALLVVAVALFFLIRAFGEALPAAAPDDPPATKTAAATAPANTLLHVLLALAAVIVACQIVGTVFVRLGQPRVIGEVVAGILLGPSLLGRVWPGATQFLFPEAATQHLQVIAQLGIVLYMFLVGLHLNAELIRNHAHATIAISHASMVIPFILGAGVALWLFPSYAPAGVSFTSFALFLGTALSITAFPVLARILTDRSLQRTNLGVLALGCAAAGDASAWCLLAFVVGVAQAQLTGALATALLALAYVALMLLGVRPLVGRRLGSLPHDRLTPGVVAWVLVALLLSALATEAIGLHAIFGAFLLGAIIPHDSAVARAFTTKLEDIVSILLLPAFFAYTGLRTEIGLVAGVNEWLTCAVIILTAVAGKFGGTLAAARLVGLDWHMSSALGVLMNTRGLMELIVLHVGLELGVISPPLFAMMVLMALATTMMTGPLLRVLRRPGESSHAGADVVEMSR